MLALAVVSGPAMAQQTFAGAGTTAGTGGTQTFSLGGYSFSINTINQVDATRLQEMGVQTVSVPAGTSVYVTSSTGQPASISTGKGPTNLIVFGPGGFAGAGTTAGTGGAGTGAGVISGPGGTMQTYSFTGNAGQYYVIMQRSDGTRDIVLVSFD